MSAGSSSGWVKEIKLPMEMAVSIGDYREVIKEIKRELRDIEKQSRQVIREGGDVDIALEQRATGLRERLGTLQAAARPSLVNWDSPSVPKPGRHNSPDQMHLANQHLAQDNSQAFAARNAITGLTGRMASNMPAWALAQSGFGGSVGNAVGMVEHYANVVQRSSTLQQMAGGVGASAAAARGALSAASAAGGIGRMVAGTMMGVGGVPVAIAATLAYTMSERADSAVGQANVRNLISSIALQTTREAVQMGDRVSLQTAVRSRAVSDAAAMSARTMMYDASAWERFRQDGFKIGGIDVSSGLGVLGLLGGTGPSAATAEAQEAYVQHAQKMFKAREVYGEGFYQALTNPETNRAVIERRISRRAAGYEGAAKMASYWANAGLAWITGSYDGLQRQLQAEEQKNWQDQAMKTAEVLRANEIKFYNESISKALDRVLSNERRRHDAAVAAENYSRWNDWATI